MKSEFDKSSKASTSLVTETLGKYGYRLDSLNKVLLNIKDSAKTRVIIETESPVFGICNEPCKGVELIDSSSNSYKFRISCISEDAGSSHFKLKSSIVTEDADGRIYIARKEKDGFVQPTMKLSKNSTVSFNTTIFTPIKIAKIYFWITGSYRKIDGTGYYPVDEIYTYALREKFTKVVVSPSLRQRIIDLVTKN